MNSVQRLPGVLDRFKVNCQRCDRTRWFRRKHRDTKGARVEALALGWRKHGRVGWICPKCAGGQKAKGPSITLPGFRHLSRNVRGSR